MKLILTTIAAALIGTASLAQTINFDGCEGVKVEGTNYYKLVDPRCKTASAQYSSTNGEDKRREMEEAAED